jgi:hypothetical protein
VICFSRRRSILELLAWLRGLARITTAIGLLACIGVAELKPSTTSTVPQKLTVHRSIRAVPRKFAVHPNGATIGVNQTQRFGVTDAEGNPVAVRWNLSGLGCSGATCGTIDDQGVYRTPSSLPHSRVVILEGVLVSDPKHSVLTEIRLEASSTVNAIPASAQLSAGKPQPLEAPIVQGQNMPRRVEVLPLPHAVAAAPVARDLNSARRVEFPLSQHVVAATPAVEQWNISRHSELRPPQQIVAAPPAVRELNRAPRVELPLPQQIIAAAPVVEKWSFVRQAELLPLSFAVAAAPVVKEMNRVPRVEFPVLPQEVVAATPVVRELNHAPRIPLPQQAVAAPPAVRELNRAPRVELPQQAVPVAPTVDKWDVARGIELPPLPHAIAATPAVQELTSAPRAEFPLPQQAVDATAAVEKWDVVRRVELPPLPHVVAAAPAVRELDRGPRVEFPLPQQAVAAPPAVERWNVVRNVELPPLPHVVASTPVVRDLSGAPRVEIPLPQQAVPAAPAVEKWDVARSVELPPLSILGVPLTRPAAAGRQNPAGSAILLPLPVEASTAPGDTVGITEHAPVVTYRNGQLTIDAENTTLADVLKLVAEKTGATIELPPGSGLERIVEHSGPGRANDVLTQLLNGSHFNFIIVNSPQHPYEPAQVVLSLQRADTDAPAAVSVAPATQPSPYWTPPADVGPVPLPPQYDSSLAAPKEELTPEARGELMKAKGRELLEKARQEAPPQ